MKCLSGIGVRRSAETSNPRNAPHRSSYLQSMSVENLERLPAAAPVKSEQSGPGTMLSGVIISVTRMNSIDAAERLPALGTASKGASRSASKNASRLVQAEYKHSLESVRRCYTGVLALAKSGHGGKTVQFRPPPPLADSLGARRA